MSAVFCQLPECLWCLGWTSLGISKKVARVFFLSPLRALFIECCNNPSLSLRTWRTWRWNSYENPAFRGWRMFESRGAPLGGFRLNPTPTPLSRDGITLPAPARETRTLGTPTFFASALLQLSESQLRKWHKLSQRSGLYFSALAPPPIL